MPSNVAVCTVEGAGYRADSDIYAHSVTRAGQLGTIELPSGELATSVDLDGVVEPALARALVLAAEAQRWEIVEQIARELRERREECCTETYERSAVTTATRLHDFGSTIQTASPVVQEGHLFHQSAPTTQ